DGAMQVSIMPNPVQESAIVHFTGATGQVSFELMDVTGKKVMETTTTRDLTLSGSAFAAGIYTYTARDQAGNIRTGKVAITH
ncbi:MAG: T9SS type A sorting domain-containing protein, partial [Bacteroidetes bacterium]|nr:T9SS type A sorting domain-containing protein [Bacteroidota bacterium]